MNYYLAISGYLLELGFSPKHKGYMYLREAIYMCLTTGGFSRLNADIFPMIAQKFCTNVCAVEKNISNAISIAWLKGDIGKIENEFGYTIDQSKGKPTVKQMIYSATEKIRLEKGDERILRSAL